MTKYDAATQSNIGDYLTEDIKELLGKLSIHSFKCVREPLLMKILSKIESPEEKVRYYWVLKLIYEYGYDSNQIDINVAAGGGATGAVSSLILSFIEIAKERNHSLLAKLKKRARRMGWTGNRAQVMQET